MGDRGVLRRLTGDDAAQAREDLLGVEHAIVQWNLLRREYAEAHKTDARPGALVHVEIMLSPRRVVRQVAFDGLRDDGVGRVDGAFRDVVAAIQHFEVPKAVCGGDFGGAVQGKQGQSWLLIRPTVTHAHNPCPNAKTLVREAVHAEWWAPRLVGGGATDQEKADGGDGQPASGAPFKATHPRPLRRRCCMPRPSPRLARPPRCPTTG